MAFEHITTAKRAMLALLEADLPHRLTQADLLADDGVTTVAPAYYYETRKEIPDGFPSLEAISSASAPVVDETEAEIYRHRIIIGFRYGGDDERALQTQVERVMWAVRHLLRDQAEPPLGTIDTGNEEYTMLPRPPGFEVPFVVGGFLEAFLTTVEAA